MEIRRNPEEYLKKIKEEEEKLKKGKLRIFFGMAAGVGKTYQMLEQAHIAKQDGHDIVIGFVEHHNRKDTINLIFNMEEVKRKKIEYRDTVLEEMDLDEILKRKPEIALIDELAHNNLPGSRHKKRYSDVLEVLNAGIDVWTTLNVQHIESRVSTVEQITGIKIGEIVPDFVVEMADKIEIIDITPQELQKRLKEGKIYSLDKTESALNNFFREGNITALREIALQVVAKLVDKDITEYKNEHNISSTWKAADKFLVAVGPSPFSEYLLYWTKKTAFSMQAEWIAVNIENSRELSNEQKAMLGKNLDTARNLGAKLLTTADEDIVAGLIRIAKQYNVTHIVVGKPLVFNFKNFMKKGITERLINESDDIDVYVVSQPGAKNVAKSKKKWKFDFKINIKDSIKLFVTLTATTILAYFIEKFTGYWGISLIYLLYIVIISTMFSRRASVLVSVIIVLLYNFLFVPPKYTLTIWRREDILVYITFLITAMAISNLTSKLNNNEKFLRKKEKNLEILYELSKEIANNSDFNMIIQKVIEYVEKFFNVKTMIYLYDRDKEEYSLFSKDGVLEEKEKDIACWVINNGIQAGRGTETLSESDYYFYPISSKEYTEGVIILNIRRRKVAEEEEFLKTVSFMIGSSILKEKIMRINQNLVVEKETEKLYSIILKSISHELKTPLTSISLAINGLCDQRLFGNTNTRDILISDIMEANDRLNRIVTNLLDMTRIESGRLKLNLQWNDLNDIISLVAAKYEKELDKFKFTRDISDNLPLIKFDFGLIEQVISNIIYNAIIHTKPKTRINIKGYNENDSVIIEISDNGGGIANIERVFDKFYKGDSKKTGSLGIGLSICKSIVEFHNWKLYAFNNEVGGVTFKIIIPN